MMNKLKIIFGFSLILSFSNLYSQVFYIDLKPEKNSIDTKGYYISSVIDGTKNNEHIGLIHSDDSLEQKQVKFRNGIEDELDTYLKKSQIVHDSSMPILIRVVYLNVQEKLTTKEYGRADIKLEFYKIKNKKVAKVYQTSAFAENYDTDVTPTHEKRIKKTIKRCLEDFENSGWEKSQLNWISLNELKTTESSDLVKPEMTATRGVNLKVSTDILNIQYSIGTKTQGLHFQYLIYNDSISVGRWFIPASYTFSGYIVNSEELQNLNYQSMNNWSFGLLLPLTKKINNRMLISIQGGIGIGAENLVDIENNITTRFIFTTYSNQLVMFVPKKKVGINFGAGLYQNFITSKVYNWDLGVKILLGLKF